MIGCGGRARHHSQKMRKGGGEGTDGYLPLFSVNIHWQVVSTWHPEGLNIFTYHFRLLVLLQPAVTTLPRSGLLVVRFSKRGTAAKVQHRCGKGQVGLWGAVAL